MKRVQKTILFLLCLCMLSHLVPCAYAEEAKDSLHEYHFVVVYDVSNSMEDVDKYKQVRDMIALLLDKIRSDMFPVKLAILPMAGSCPAVDTVEPGDGLLWWELESYDSGNIKTIKEKLKDLEYKGYTDIGQALQACNQKLSKMRGDSEDCTQIVLFVTDGFPDCSGASRDKKFEAIWDSYNNAIEVAETFPIEAYFLGIVPDEASRESILTYNDDHTGIIKYYDNPVPEAYAAKMIEVSQCMQKFCEILHGRQGEGATHPAQIYEVGWNSPDAINTVDRIYQKFFEQAFSAKATERKEQELTQGITFNVPEIVSECNITIIPDAKAFEEQKDKVQKCLQQLTVSYENELCEFFKADSEYAVTVRLVNPKAGSYTLKCEDIASATLRFYAYGSIQIVPDQSYVEGHVGEEIHFTGELRNGAQRKLSSDVEKFIKLSIIELDKSEYVSEYDGEKWSVDLTLDEPGQYAFTLKMEYDDTQNGDPLSGVSQFYAQIPLYADIVPNPIPDPPPEPTPEPNQLHAFMEQLAQKPYLLLAALVIAGLILLTARHFRCHKFEVIFEDGTVKTIYVTKQKNRFVPTKIEGLEICYVDEDHWEYVYHRGTPHRIIENKIKL